MHVYGELIRAQWEILTSDPSAGREGRVWWNTTSNRFKGDDGSNIVSFFDSRNSLVPDVASSYDIGSSGAYYKDIYIAGLHYGNIIPGLTASDLGSSSAYFDEAYVRTYKSTMTGSRALYTNTAGDIATSVVTQSELEALSGLSGSSLEVRLDSIELLATKKLLLERVLSTSSTPSLTATDFSTASSTFNFYYFTSTAADINVSLPTITDVGFNYLIGFQHAGATSSVVHLNCASGVGDVIDDLNTSIDLVNFGDYVVLFRSPNNNSGFKTLIYRTTSRIRVETSGAGAAGYGSTNNVIRRFSSTVVSSGKAITFADSSTLGSTFTIKETGMYSIGCGDSDTGSGAYIGISRNSTQLTTSVQGITSTHRLAISQTASSVNNAVFWMGRLVAGDVIRSHGDGGADATSNLCWFDISRIN